MRAGDTIVVGGREYAVDRIVEGQVYGRRAHSEAPQRIGAAYTLRDSAGECDLTADTFDAACHEAEDLLRAVDWGSTSTIRVSGRVIELDERGEVDRMVYAVIPPVEPTCERAEHHDWAEGDVHAAGGGGVARHNVCRRCGLVERHDTWVDDGLGGHMESVRYIAP